MSVFYRLRFSVLNVLLVATIVAIASAYWKSEQQLDQLHHRVAELEEENEGLRNRCGLLTIKDRSRFHVIDSSRGNTGWTSNDLRRERTWKLWIPEGKSLELHIATGWYSKGEFPDESPKGPIILPSGDHQIRMTMMTGPQMSNWHLQLATGDRKRSLSARWLRWKDATVASSVRFVPSTNVFDGTTPEVLWLHGIQRQSTQEKDGFIVWLLIADE